MAFDLSPLSPPQLHLVRPLPSPPTKPSTSRQRRRPWAFSPKVEPEPAMPRPRRRRRWLAGSDAEPPQPRRSELKNLGLGVGGWGCGHRREEAAMGVFRGEVGVAEDRRWWPALPSRGADMECGGRGHPHLIFSPLSGGGAAQTRCYSTGRIFNRGHG
jgi:hypothetical protein